MIDDYADKSPFRLTQLVRRRKRKQKSIHSLATSREDKPSEQPAPAAQSTDNTQIHSTNNQPKRILFVCTEDWFFQSHFLPLNEAALSLGTNYNTTLISTTNGIREGLQALGLTLLPFDFTRRSANPQIALRQVWLLAKHIRDQRPDLIHFIALRPILIGGLASLITPRAGKIFHVTGLGSIAEGQSRLAGLFRIIAFRLVSLYLKQRKSFLIVENPDDLQLLKRYGSISDNKVSLFGGAGVDPDVWTAMPPPNNKVPHAAFVGRLIWTKGVDVLIEAMKLLEEKGVKLNLDLYGEPDPGNPKSVNPKTLEEWNQLPNVSWHGRTNDVQLAWYHADIGVVPTRTREGMPRAMLEAAACARPQVVTDVPGPRHFIRNSKEGLVIPPEDSQALAEALEKLAINPALRQQMGEAARQRVLVNYTEQHVRDKIQQIYQTLLK